jgi:UDP-glucose 4-epimerase
VTGGAGFLGPRVVRRLLDRGTTVCAIDNLANAATLPPDIAEDPRFELRTVDVRDAVAMVRTFVDVEPELVVHLAALHFIPACVRDPATTLEVNVVGTQHAIDACRPLREPPRFVLASTADVYEPSLDPHRETSKVAPDNVYGLSKLTAEHLVHFAGSQAIVRPLVCRLFNLFGSRETNPHVIPAIVEQLRQGDTIRLGNTTPKRDFVEISDAADAIVRLSDVAPSDATVNVGTGAAYSVDEVIEMIRELTGRDVRVEVDRDRWRASDRPILAAANDVLRSLLPDALPTSFREGLRRLLVDEGVVGVADD